MKVGTVVNIINVYNQYQAKLNMDYQRLAYYKSIGSKLGIQQAEADITKDTTELGEFLDYEI